MIKSFENFKDSKAQKELLILNPEADAHVEEGISQEKVLETLNANGFFENEDFLLGEAFDVKYEGHEGNDKIFISINGKKYGYGKKEGGLELGDIARKFEKMLQFSAGRALTWLKKNTELVAGSKAQEEADAKHVKEGHEGEKNYMFFQNLKTIKECAEKMMALEKSQVDSLIENGHDWASDHIATSKDDVEEVCNWLCNEVAEPVVEYHASGPEKKYMRLERLLKFLEDHAEYRVTAGDVVKYINGGYHEHSSPEDVIELYEE